MKNYCILCERDKCMNVSSVCIREQWCLNSTTIPDALWHDKLVYFYFKYVNDIKTNSQLNACTFRTRRAVINHQSQVPGSIHDTV